MAVSRRRERGGRAMDGQCPADLAPSPLLQKAKREPNSGGVFGKKELITGAIGFLDLPTTES